MLENYKFTIMKELSTEEKARAYDEALEIANAAYKDEDRHLKATLERIFPELKESDDVQHRKFILEYLYDGLRKSDEQFKGQFKCAINWFEKQDEQKPTIEMKSAEESLGIDSETYNKIVDECIYGEQKPDTDFSDLRTWKYIVDAVWTEKEGIGQYLDSPFTEEVAKKLQKRFGNIEQKPAEWKQENVEELSEFENAMMHIGYSFFGEMGGLDPNNTSSVKVQAQYLLELAQKSAEWSEEDERMIDNIIFELEENQENINGVGYKIDWLKSIKQKIGG